MEKLVDGMPLKLTALAEVKYEPFTVTVEPRTPVLGEKLLTIGAGMVT